MTWTNMETTVLFGIFWILLLREINGSGLECGYPGAPSFGRPHPLKERYRPGEAVSYTCSPGYALQGSLQRLCQIDGTWTGALPLCDRSLSSVDMHASSRQTLGLYPAEKSIDGDPRTCTYTDKIRPRWIRVDMRADHKVRAVSLTVPQGIYSQDAAQLTIYAISVRDSTTASYHKCATFNGRFASPTLRVSCAGGGVEGRYIHVEDNRRRIDYFSLCEIDVFVHKGSYECGEAERPAHAYSVRTDTGAVNYKCLHGYRLEGPSTRLCQDDGRWSSAQPICAEITCPPLPVIPHGRLVYSGGAGFDSRPTLGATTNLTCNYGFEAAGPAHPLVCGEDGQWRPLPDNLSCQPVECGHPPARHSSDQFILLNGTRYGAVALLRCGTSDREEGEQESVVHCREDGKWSAPQIDCAPADNGLSRLGLVEEEQGDVPTGIVIGMAVVVFLLLVTVILVLLLKRRKILRQNSTDSLPPKKENSASAPPQQQPYDNDAFYATIPPPHSAEAKRTLLSTVLFPNHRRRKSGSSPSSKDSGHSSSSGCIYEEVGGDTPMRVEQRKMPGGATAVETEAVYAQVDLDEKRRSRLNKTLVERFEPVDPPQWEGTYRSEGAYDEVDLEPIKLRELPPIPPSDEEGITYASLSLPLDPPPSTLSRKNDIYQGGPDDTVMKENDLYRTNDTLKV